MEVRVKRSERRPTEVCGLRAESHTKVSPKRICIGLGVGQRNGDRLQRGIAYRVKRGQLMHRRLIACPCSYWAVTDVEGLR